MTTPQKKGGSERSRDRVAIGLLPTGVSGLDEILGGGLPEYSFNMVVGGPGCGKTTMTHQIMFANASEDYRAIYFTILGEPAVKMLRYQQQFDFFDTEKLGSAIRFVNLSDLVLEGDLGGVLDRIAKEVEDFDARMVVVDSFRSVMHESRAGMDLQEFVQRLALHLTSWQVTSFLIGEYTGDDPHYNPVTTVADGLFRLQQNVERNSVVRKLQVLKLRGQESIPGLHTIRITEAGLEAFPRTFGLSAPPSATRRQRRLSTGLPGLDKLMGGGIPEGDSILLAGPSGSGKTTFGSHFIAEGLNAGEPGVMAVFEELPAEFVQRNATLGIEFASAQEADKLRVVYIRPLDLSVDETLLELAKAVREIGAKRVVIDSLAGFEMALAPEFRLDFRESLYRMIGALTRMGVTVVSTVETEDNFTSMALSNFAVSFLADDLVRLRYVSIEGQLRKILMVIKMRGSAHSHDMVEYKIDGQGISIGEPLRGYRELTTGIPRPYSMELDPDAPNS